MPSRGLWLPKDGTWKVQCTKTGQHWPSGLGLHCTALLLLHCPCRCAASPHTAARFGGKCFCVPSAVSKQVSQSLASFFVVFSGLRFAKSPQFRVLVHRRQSNFQWHVYFHVCPRVQRHSGCAAHGRLPGERTMALRRTMQRRCDPCTAHTVGVRARCYSSSISRAEVASRFAGRMRHAAFVCVVVLRRHRMP